MSHCTKCKHNDSFECMLLRLRPGYYSDQAWIDAGAPARCYCKCHGKEAS